MDIKIVSHNFMLSVTVNKLMIQTYEKYQHWTCSLLKQNTLLAPNIIQQLHIQ